MSKGLIERPLLTRNEPLLSAGSSITFNYNTGCTFVLFSLPTEPHSIFYLHLLTPATPPTENITPSHIVLICFHFKLSFLHVIERLRYYFYTMDAIYFVRKKVMVGSGSRLHNQKGIIIFSQKWQMR